MQLDDNTEGLEGLMESADMASFHKMMDASLSVTHQPDDELDNAVYAQCFSEADAGKLVLLDLYRRYVNVSIAVPNGPDAAHAAMYRGGMQQVVFDIAHRIMKAHQGD